jgi:hypothetical protein
MPARQIGAKFRTESSASVKRANAVSRKGFEPNPAPAAIVDARIYLWDNVPPAKECVMKRSPRSRKTPSQLSSSVQDRLSTYAIAAGATGVSLLALAQPSVSEIVYTPANQTVNLTVGSYGLDLNKDGIVDFIIADHRSFESPGIISRQSLFVKPAASQNRINCVYASCLSTFIYAAGLFRGSQIGPSQQRHGWLAGHAQMALEERFEGKPYYFGSFNRVSDRYLGLQFQIDGETHYGWARFTVKFHGGAPNVRSWEAHLTGYAYETIADQSIKAGQTADKADDVSGAPAKAKAVDPAPLAALGKLALGADGIALWRREEESAANPENR